MTCFIGMEGGLCPTTRKSISPDWQQSAGQFGEQEMQCALIKKIYQIS
jgi:hypothetical protein